MREHWIHFLAGAWLVISGFVVSTLDGARTNLIVTGLIVAVVAIWGLYATRDRMGTMTR